MIRIIRNLAAAALVLGSTSVLAQTVTVGSDSGTAGATVVIPVNFVAGVTAVGSMDIDVDFDAAKFSDATGVCTVTDVGQALKTCSKAAGKVRISIAGDGTNALTTGLAANINFTIADPVAAGGIDLDGMIFAASNVDGSAELPDGTITVNDGVLTIVGAAYKSTPAQGPIDLGSVVQGDTDPKADVVIDNIGAVGSSLDGSCSITANSTVFSVDDLSDFSVPEAGPNSTRVVSCDSSQAAASHAGEMSCTHNGDNIGDAVYPLSCNIEAFTAKSPGINAGHSGAWFNPVTSGQGQFIDVVPEEQFMFISWFTFTDAASDNPNEQQWYTAQGNYSGDTAVLDLFETLGGKFDDPQEVTTTQVGEVILSFSDCDMGLMSYLFDEEELEGEFPLIRVIPGSDNVCEGLSGNNTQAVDINAGMDGAWFDPDTSGQGYFIDAHPDPEGGNFIFVSWFTYGDETASGQRWLTAQGSFEGSVAEIDVFETTGGSFDDPQPVSTTKVGAMSLDFTDCSNAQLTYSLPADPAVGDIAITRVIPGSQALCEELAGAD